MNLLGTLHHDEAEAAVRYLNSDPESFQFGTLLYKALPSWSRVEPDAAQTFVEEQMKDPAGATALVLQGRAMEDHEEALSSALVKAEELSTDKLSQSELFDSYLKAIVTGLTDAGRAQIAIDLAQDIESSTTRQILYKELVDKLGAAHHGEMLQLIEELPVSQRGGLAQSLIIRSDDWNRGGASGEWVINQEGIDRRDALLELSVERWLASDPDAVEQWVSDRMITTPDMDGAVRALVHYLQNKELSKAVEWAERISNSEERGQLTKELLAEPS